MATYRVVLKMAELFCVFNMGVSHIGGPHVVGYLKGNQQYTSRFRGRSLLEKHPNDLFATYPDRLPPASDLVHPALHALHSGLAKDLKGASPNQSCQKNASSPAGKNVLMMQAGPLKQGDPKVCSRSHRIHRKPSMSSISVNLTRSV